MYASLLVNVSLALPSVFFLRLSFSWRLNPILNRLRSSRFWWWNPWRCNHNQPSVIAAYCPKCEVFKVALLRQQRGSRTQNFMKILLQQTCCFFHSLSKPSMAAGETLIFLLNWWLMALRTQELTKGFLSTTGGDSLNDSTEVYRLSRQGYSHGWANSTLLHSTTKATGPVRLLIKVYSTSLLVWVILPSLQSVAIS